MNKHKLGEWKVLNGANTFYIADNDGFYPVYVAKTISDSRQDQFNAKLIAAAPELLEALKELLQPNNVLTKKGIVMAAKAIAKAEEI